MLMSEQKNALFVERMSDEISMSVGSKDDTSFKKMALAALGLRRYGCSSCGGSFSAGSYHGFAGEWYRAVYCRECGRTVTLKVSAGQYLSAFPGGKPPDVYRYELTGAVTPEVIEIAAGATEPPQVECICGAKGPFGKEGPLTDDDPGSTCPHCKTETLKLTGTLIV